jgi:cytochrome c peroxidase
MKRSQLLSCGLVALLGAAAPMPSALAATPTELMAAYTAKAGAPASPERGKKLFMTNHGADFGWSCSTCHTENPAKTGKHAISEKPIEPLAPSANAKRFTNANKVELHFNTNCKDVVGRECTAGEKADVISWLLTVKP